MRSISFRRLAAAMFLAGLLLAATGAAVYLMWTNLQLAIGLGLMLSIPAMLIYFAVNLIHAKPDGRGSRRHWLAERERKEKEQSR